MGKKIAEETIELYEMLRANSQQKSARDRRVGVNKVQTNNEMAAQLTKLTRQVAFLNSRTQQSNEVCRFCGLFGQRANMCLQNLYEPEQVNYTDANQPRPCFDPYSNTYNHGWRSHPNFSWRNTNNAPMQNVRPNPMSNNTGSFNQPRKSTLEETLNTFIKFGMDNHKRHDQRLDSLEASMKRVEVQVGQIAKQLQGHQKGKLPS